MPRTIASPAVGEYADFHAGYIAAIAGEPDAVTLLERQQQHIERLRRLGDRANHRYAAGKWTIREIVGHLSDAERVVSYRLLCVARGEQTPLPGFDEQAYVAASNAGTRSLDDLVDELAVVRTATLILARSLDDESLSRRGVVNTWSMTTRGLVFVIAGHFQHHVNVLRDRYGVTL